MVIQLVKSIFCNEEETRKKLADFVMTTPFFSMGAECAKFEKAFSEKQGRKYSVLVNSGSSANLLLIQALLNVGKLKKGDVVGISALTWATNVMPLIQLGLTPRALDVELDTLNVSHETLLKNLDLDALFITNALGFCGDLQSIEKTCKDKDILFIEDNCESLGSKAYGKLLGNFGLASTFSFYLGHHISTIEGGIVCTDDKELYDALLMARAHGWDRQLDEETKSTLREGRDPFYSLYTFYDLGYNLRPTEITGFLGNEQLPFWDEIVSARDRNFRKYNLDFKLDHMEIISAFSIPCFKDKSKFTGVEIRPIISGNITEQPFYKKYVGEENCPNATYIHQNGFYFTNNHSLTDEEVETLKSL